MMIAKRLSKVKRFALLFRAHAQMGRRRRFADSQRLIGRTQSKNRGITVLLFFYISIIADLIVRVKGVC